MGHILARKSSSSLRYKQLEPGSVTPSSTTPSDQKPREGESVPYKDARYETLLATTGQLYGRIGLRCHGCKQILYRTLHEKEQTVPQDSLFRDDRFDKSRRTVQGRNEAKVIQDITRLIVPSAQTLAICGATHLGLLIESINEG